MVNREVPEVKTNKWADPPADILTRILKHLDLNTDLTRLRGVCSSWRSALPLHQHTNYRSFIQVPSLSDGNHHRPLFLLETAFYFFSPLNPCGEGSSDSNEWVARMGQIAPNKWRLLNPLSYHDEYNPEANGNEYLLTDPPIVGEINLLDCRVFMLAKALALVGELDFNAKPISTKVVGQWDLTSSTRPLSAILVLLAPEHVAGLSSRLLLLRPNDAQKQENEWVEINESGLEDKKQNNFVAFDIAYSNGIFFVFQVNGDRWRVGTVNPSIKRLVLKPFASGRIIQTLSSVSLVPSELNDCVYLVVEPKYGNIQCLNLMNEVKGTSQNYEDDILFCSNYVSFSFQSSKLLNNTLLQDKNFMAILYMFSNHVRFNKFTTGNSFLYSNLMPEGVKGLNLVKYRRYKENISLWHTTIKDKNEKSVLDIDDGKNRVLLFDVMPEKEQDVYTRLLFPPPAWVKWRCLSLDNVEIKLHELKDEYSSDDNGYTYVETDFDYVYGTSY